MDDTVPTNNEEHFFINRGVRWKLMTCPVCDAAHFRTYRELIYHMAYPPNCLNNIRQRNQLPEDEQIGPVMAPVFFPLRLILMLLWSVIWLCYQICYYTIPVPIIFSYNLIASMVLFVASLPQQYYGSVGDAFSVPALPVAPVGEYLTGLSYHTYQYIIVAPAVYIYETTKACVQFMRDLLGRSYRNVDAAVRAIPRVTGFFQRLYQNTRDIGANSVVSFGRSIKRALYSVYHYLLEAPYTYASDAIANVGRYIAGVAGGVSQYCADTIASTFQNLVRAVDLVHQNTIAVSIAWIYTELIEPCIAFVRYMIAAPGRLFQQARYLIVVRFAAAIDRFIGAERAFVQRVFISVEDKLKQMYEDIDWLNSAMYNFVYFPIDMPIGTTFWMRFVYRAFFFIHLILLIYMCICCYLQLAILFVSNVIYVK